MRVSNRDAAALLEVQLQLAPTSAAPTWIDGAARASSAVAARREWCLLAAESPSCVLPAFNYFCCGEPDEITASIPAVCGIQ
jgi:hypothetical protein